MSTSQPSVQGARRKNTSRSRRDPARRRQPHQSYVTQHQLKGGAIHVPPNPPSTAYQPWQSLTVVHSGKSGDISITVGNLCDQIAAQIDPIKTGLSLTPILNIKIHRIRAWNITGNMIALSVDDYSDVAKSIADVDALCGLVDTGTSQHIPAVGFDMPSTHRDIVLRNGKSASSATDAVIYHVMSTKSDTVITYVNLVWKFDGPSKFSAFENNMMSVLNTISEATATTSSSVGSIESAVKEMRAHAQKQGIGSFVLDGVKTLAPYVLPAVGSAYERPVREFDEKITKLITAVENLDLSTTDPSLTLKDWVLANSADTDEA